MPNPALLVICGDAERGERLVSSLWDAGWRDARCVPGLAEAAGWLCVASNACVIVDAEPADISGLKAVQILQKFCPRVRVIFSTPENSRELEAQARAAGVFYYYISSTDRAELVEAIRDAINSPTPEQARQPRKVLIVDDDDDFHTFVRVILKLPKYQTLSAYSGQEGLDIARRERPDAILLDIIMRSTTDGFEFCREAKRDPQVKHIPILGVSAIEERMGVRWPAGPDSDLFPVDGYLSKPITPERLLEELRRLIPRKG